MQGVGYSVYYFGMAMFSWMTILCIDVCWTFAKSKVPKKKSDQ